VSGVTHLKLYERQFSQSYRASWYYQSFITNWCTI